MEKLPASALSLRQRRAQGNGGSPQSVAATSRARGQQKRSGIRLNKVLGRIVPLILLAYVYYTYRLVVLRYGVQYLYQRQHMRLEASVWLFVLHLVFLGAVRAYFCVFFAHSANLPNDRTPTPWLRQKLGASFPLPQPSYGNLCINPASFAGTIELCHPDGTLVRCFRDQCNGRIKTFRTRHCGDCGTCRIGFDHHCAWFDNDITAPATLRSFLFFLCCVPPLIGLAVAPLLPSAWKTAKLIASFAVADTQLRDSWWHCWYSWLGGPVFRWMVGWCIGAQRWSRSARSDRLPHEVVSSPLVVGFGAVLIIIASSLASSTLLNLSEGLLTVDVERLKAFKRLSRRREKAAIDIAVGRRPQDDAILEELDAKMQLLTPVSHFRVSIKEHTTILPVTVQDGLFRQGQVKDNLRYFLWDHKAWQQMQNGWLLSQQALGHISITLCRSGEFTTKS